MRVAPVALVVALLAAACGDDGATGNPDGETGPITVYSGRGEDLVGPVIDLFTEATGVQVDVRYGDTAELAAQILEEGANTPADVFFAQDAGALGALAQQDLFASLDQQTLNMLPAGFRADDGSWVGISGRARVVVYNTDEVSEEDLPDSILGFTDARWNGTIGWAPTNGSFQAFVTGLRLLAGDDAARAWLQGIRDNGAQVYENNTSIVEAVGRGEIQVGFVNHYYLMRLLAENPDLSAANHFIGGGDPGALVNVAGAGVLASSDDQATARRLIDFLLGADAQRYFAEQTYEYPMIDGVEIDERLTPLAQLDPPQIDLSRLADLEATLAMLGEEGLL